MVDLNNLGGLLLIIRAGVFGVILASGQSKRMGKPKLLLPWQGYPLIEHLLDKISLFPFEEVKVVIPDQNEQLEKVVTSYGCKPIYNVTPQQGMGHSLSLAFRSLPSSAEAALILLGDQPKINSNDIRKVGLAFNGMRSNQKSCPKIIIQMKYRDGRVGHPILFSHHFFDEFKLLKGDKGGRDIIRNNVHFLYQCTSENEYPEDIDTPYDYNRLIQGKEEG